MPKNFIRKTFDRWLTQNRKRFKYPPKVVNACKNYFEIKFTGIAPELHFTIKNTGAVIWVYNHLEPWEILWEFDIAERRTPNGDYCCNICFVEKHHKIYSSRKELWEKHCFEELLEWVNDNFKTSNWIRLRDMGDGWKESALINEKDLREEINCEDVVVRLFPIMKKGVE